MEAFVLDVSSYMPWCCEGESNEASEEMLQLAIDGAVLHVPSVWTWEILNTVSVVVRRRRISADRGLAFLEQLVSFNFQIDRAPKVVDFSKLYSLANLLPLATRDVDLSRAANAEGVVII